MSSRNARRNAAAQAAAMASRRSSGKSRRQRAPRSRARDSNFGWSVIEKDEQVAVLSGTTAFATTKFAINPALAATFPIGAPEAKRWTEWKADSLEFYYKRTVSEFADQGQTGQVVLSCDYSALNDAPASLQAAQALQHTVGMPSTATDLRLRLDVNVLNKADPKYIRSANPPPSADIRLYDGGNLWVSTVGCYDTSQIGILYAKYRFRVRLPNLDDTPVLTSRNLSQFGCSSEMPLVTATPYTLYNGEVVGVSTNPLGITEVDGVFTLPAGAYHVSYNLTVADDAAEAFAVVSAPKKDGVAISNMSSSFSHPAGAGQFPISGQAYVESDGTNTFRVDVTATGAAGNLKIVSGRASMSFLAV